MLTCMIRACLPPPQNLLPVCRVESTPTGTEGQELGKLTFFQPRSKTPGRIVSPRGLSFIWLSAFPLMHLLLSLLACNTLCKILLVAFPGTPEEGVRVGRVLHSLSWFFIKFSNKGNHSYYMASSVKATGLPAVSKCQRRGWAMQRNRHLIWNPRGWRRTSPFFVGPQAAIERAWFSQADIFFQELENTRAMGKGIGHIQLPENLSFPSALKKCKFLVLMKVKIYLKVCTKASKDRDVSEYSVLLSIGARMVWWLWSWT